MSLGQYRELASAIARAVPDGCAQKWSNNGAALRAMLTRELSKEPSQWPPQLKGFAQVAAIALPNPPSTFRISDGFHARTVQSTGVQLVHVTDDFANEFIRMVERNIPAGGLLGFDYRSLIRTTSHGDVFKHLCNGKTSYLSDIWILLRQQPCGPRSKPGPLLVDGAGNIFYVKNAHGAVWRVYIRWSDVGPIGWGVEAAPLVDRQTIHPGNRIFARQFVEA